MKHILTTLAAAALLLAPAISHERLTIGPAGGRLIMLDSPSTPNAEFSLTKDNKAQIELLDGSRKPIALDKQSLVVTAGPRSKTQKFTADKTDGKFTAGPLPAGNDYYIVFQLKETDAAKAITFRVHYNTKVCEECKKPEFICICGNKGTGKEIEVPAKIDGLWAELNQHHSELKEGYKDKAYEALDEVTDAFPILAAALPAKSKDLTTEQQKAVAEGSAAVVKALAEVKAANDARKLGDAKASMDAVATNIESLKKNYPKETANAKLKE